MVRELRFAARQLTKSPGFTALAVLTLAVAIGVNSAIFSIINGVVLRPMVPVRPAEVVNLYTSWKDADRDYRPFSYQELRALREESQPFSEVAAVQHVMVGIGENETRRRSFAVLTSDNFFRLMGTRPAAGRFYDEAESRPNANVRVAVASHALWKRMGARADFVGSRLEINGRSYTIIGVTAEGFSGLHAVLAPDLWLPLGVHGQLRPTYAEGAAGDLLAPRAYRLDLMARLAPGVSEEAARARLPALAERLTALQPPGSDGGRRARDLQMHPPPRFTITSVPKSPEPVGLFGVLLMGMAAVVLLIASLNLANMLLARGTTRRREIAVRLALGASRGQVVRQLLAEGLLLAAAGGAAGLLLSIWGNDLLVHSLGGLFTSVSFSMVLDLEPDALAVAVTLALCLLATLVFSLGPALRTSRADLVTDLKQEAGEPAGGDRLHRFFAPRHLLVMAQMALSLSLLFAAGLVLRGAIRAAGEDPGFHAQGTLVTEMDFTLGDVDDASASRSMQLALQRARELPGVTAAAIGTVRPYGDHTLTRRFVRAGASPVADGAPGVSGIYSAISSGYFDTLGVRLLRGRDFTAQEGAAVAILDARMAATLFPDGDAVGRRIRYTQPPLDGGPAELEVVGVVASHRHEVFGEVPRRVFVPLARALNEGVFMYAHFGSADRAAVLAALPVLRQALRTVAPDLPVLEMTPFEDLLDRNVELWMLRLAAVLFGVLGGIALLLAAVGVYGVKSYLVARRTREIGIRVALGARPGHVLSLVMKQATLQTMVALAAGVLVALAAGRLLARLLFRVSPADPLALVLASAVLAATALLACFLPARRATRVSPMSALRTE
jgi:predicted permease